MFSNPTVGSWYDPTDLSTMFQDSLGTTPVTAPGQSVGLRLDKSGRGNHATQATAGARLTYGIEPKTGTRNLLQQTEVFDNAYWTAQAVDFAANSAVAPDGTLTADKIIPTAVSTTHAIFRVGVVSSQTCAISFYMKSGGYDTVHVRDGATASNGAVFNSATGVVTNTGTGVGSMSPMGDGWYRCVVIVVTTGVRFYVPTAAANFTGDGTSGVFLWGAQIETGSVATAYQKVVTAFEVTEAGVQTCHYCAYAGANSMATAAIDFTATDKMSVFAGLRKSSDATISIVAEISAGGLNGSFFLSAPRNAGVANYGFFNQGTTSDTAISGSTFAAPITNVVTGLGNISGDTTTLRINGVQAAQVTTDLGTGNYGNYPLYIGARAGTSFFFTGRDYGIIVVGKSASPVEIRNAEAFLANNTPNVTL